VLKYRYLTGDHTTWQDIPSLWRRGAFCWVNYTTAYLVCNLFSVMIITVRTSAPPRGQRRGGRWVKQERAGIGAALLLVSSFAFHIQSQVFPPSVDFSSPRQLEA